MTNHLCWISYVRIDARQEDEFLGVCLIEVNDAELAEATRSPKYLISDLPKDHATALMLAATHKARMLECAPLGAVEIMIVELPNTGVFPSVRRNQLLTSAELIERHIGYFGKRNAVLCPSCEAEYGHL